MSSNGRLVLKVAVVMYGGLLVAEELAIVLFSTGHTVFPVILRPCVHGEPQVGNGRPTDPDTRFPSSRPHRPIRYCEQSG